MSDVLERIGKVLIQAERAATEEERDTFFEKAQFLASKYSVELEVARQSVTNKELREKPISKKITIGEPRKPLNATFCELFMAIGGAQDLKFNIAHNSTYVIAFGFPSDIRIAEAMYAHLSLQMVEEADRFIRGGTWKGETFWGEVRRKDEWGYSYTSWEEKPVHARVARRSFYESFISTVGRRLRAAKRKAEAAREEELHNFANADGTNENVSTALVLVRKTEEIGDFYEKTSTARGSWKGSNNTYSSARGHSAGHSAGSNARLGGQQSLPGARKGLN